MDISISSLANYLEGLRLEKGGVLGFLQTGSAIVLRDKLSNIQSDNEDVFLITDPFSLEELSAVRSVENGGLVLYEEAYYYSFSIESSSLGWDIFYMIPTTYIDREVDEIVDSARNILILVIAAVCIFGLLGVSLIVIFPIRSLTSSIRNVSKNETGEIVLPRVSHDEIGVLNSSFKILFNKLVSHQEHLEELVEEKTKELSLSKAEAEEAKDIAMAATRTKSEFLANMSHEIRTPMNAIIGMSYLALRTELNDKQKDYLDKISMASKSLLNIINDILDFSKIEAGKLEIESSEFRLDEVLMNLANLNSQKAVTKGLEFLFKSDPEIPEMLIGDPLRLGQILLNLVSNAIKFTDNGEILVSAKVKDIGKDKVILNFRVQDSGIGMTSEQANKLFQSFT